MKRLFAFGCSCTNWIWPTWADIYATQFDFFENWGLPSAGNLYIFNSIIEANKRHNFNNDDTVVVMWSGMLRFDSYFHERWNLYDKEHGSIRGSEIINVGYMSAIHELFESKKVNYTFLSMSEYTIEKDIYRLYKDTIDIIKPHIKYHTTPLVIDIDLNCLESYKGCHGYIRDQYDYLKGPIWPTFEDYIKQYPTLEIDDRMKTMNSIIKNLWKRLQNDTHPTPVIHLKNLQHHFEDFQPDQKTIDWIYEYEDLISRSNYVIYNSNMPTKKLK
jgi:hypothetical protein